MKVRVVAPDDILPGGFLIAELGRVPRLGETVVLEDLGEYLTVTNVAHPIDTRTPTTQLVPEIGLDRIDDQGDPAEQLLTDIFGVASEPPPGASECVHCGEWIKAEIGIPTPWLHIYSGRAECYRDPQHTETASPRKD